jgi:DNA-binding GntR family transcriptional regulator
VAEDCQQGSDPAGRREWTEVKRRSLGDGVADSLRALILRGDLQPGQRLGEVEISQRLGVSRGPIREALVRLAQEGLVVSKLHYGASVIELTKSDVAELALLRTALEQLAVSQAIKCASESDFDRLREVVDHMRAARKGDVNATLVQLDMDFHDALFRAAHHERLFAAWTAIRSQVVLALLQRRLFSPDYRKIIVEEHALLTAVLVEKNVRRAKSEIATHIEGAYLRLNSAYEEPSSVVN